MLCKTKICQLQSKISKKSAPEVVPSSEAYKKSIDKPGKN